MFRAVESRKDRQWKGIEFKESRGNFPRERDRVSAFKYHLSARIYYIYIRLERTIDEISFAKNFETIFRRKKESSRKFLADECETACTRFDAWKEAGYTRTNVQLYTNPRKRRYRERERERKERDAVSERRPRASRPSPLYRRPRRSHLSSSPRFTTSLLGHVCESPRYVFDLCAHLLALNAGGEGNRFRTD